MRPGQPHNVAIAELEINGRPARITGTAVTADDDAIQFIMDMMKEQGIPGSRALRLYSERKPSEEWLLFFKNNWPHVPVTWSFEPGEDAKMEKAVDKLLSRKKPWWRFW